MKVAQKHKRLLRVSFTALYLSGATYWLLRQFFRKSGEFGPEPGFYERVFGPAHFVLALFFIFTIGTLWITHIKPSIRGRQHRFSGWLFLFLLGCLVGTGTVLLYGSEDMIKLAEKYHPWFGLLLLPTLAFHWMSKSQKPRCNESRARGSLTDFRLQRFEHRRRRQR
ncbi:MAG: hypothetical protein P4M08_05355 [Oligoflexia bacterium]|nr:hypothetical protein [Oligoflexia bacterium]